MLHIANDPGAQGDWLGQALAAERPALTRLCQRLTGNSSDAEDLAQETLLAAWRLRDRITAPEGMSAWLAAIARNLARRWARARYGARARLIPLDVEDAGAPFLDDTSDLLERLERDEINALARRALDLAPEATRALLASVYLSEQAAATGAEPMPAVSSGALRVRLTRARQALRKALSAHPEMRAELEDMGLTLPAADGWMSTRIWCPFCGAAYLRYRIDRAAGAYTIVCAGGCHGTGVAGGARNLDLVNAISSPKTLITRHCLMLETEYRTALARGWDDCVCGNRAAFGVVTPETTPPGWPAGYGLYGACPRCGRIDNSTAWHLALDTTEAQRFWRRYPRMRSLPVYGVARDGRPAVVTGFEAVGGQARLEIISDARDYTVLTTTLTHTGA